MDKDWQIAATEAWDRPGLLSFWWWEGELPASAPHWVMAHRLNVGDKVYLEGVNLWDPTPEDAVAALQILREKYDSVL